MRQLLHRPLLLSVALDKFTSPSKRRHRGIFKISLVILP